VSTLPVDILPVGGVLVPGGNPLAAAVPAAGRRPQGSAGSAPLGQDHVDFDGVAEEVGDVASIAACQAGQT